MNRDAAPARRGADSAVKSAERVLAILELLADRERPLTFGQLAEDLGYPRSSLHGLLHTMLGRGWLEVDEATRRYSLGIRVWQSGHSYLRAVGLEQRARPYLERVRDALDETVQLSVLDGRYNVYIAKEEGTQRLVLASEVGRRLEAHATGLGKVLLAGLPEDVLAARMAGAELARFTPSTITSFQELSSELSVIREQGYAEDDEEYTIGVRCVAVPVRDHTGAVVAAMSMSVPTVRFNRLLRQRALNLLLDAANGLSRALGSPAT